MEDVIVILHPNHLGYFESSGLGNSDHHMLASHHLLIHALSHLLFLAATCRRH